MAENQSGDQVQARKIEKMGHDLGLLHYELWNDLAWLHAKWEQFRHLFASDEEAIALMNRTAPSFFFFLQTILFDDVLLQIARLTDPPESMGRANLTLQRLPAAVSDPTLRSKADALLQNVIARTQFARDRRNRRIAHRDLLTARGLHPDPLAPASRLDVEAALSAMRELMNTIESHYEGSQTAYQHFIQTGGADHLLAWLKRALRDRNGLRNQKLR